MRRSTLICMLIWLVLGTSLPTWAQTFPTSDYFRRVWRHPELPNRIREPQGLKDYVISGRLRLALDDAVRLLLLNNTEVRIRELQQEEARLAILRAYQPFDPVVDSNFFANRTTSPARSELDGAPTLSSLSQNSLVSYSQAFQTGTRGSVSFNSQKQADNSVFTLLNPSLFASLNFSLSQPLLKGRGLFPNRAPILIAQRNLKRTHQDFEASLNEAIANMVEQYWEVISLRENLKIQRNSLELAEATYKQNKRALELGALPPLDIYRSESEVATRRVFVIQAEYFLKQAEDRFRRTLGADLDSIVASLDLDLVESTEPAGNLFQINTADAMDRAFQRRPELESLREQLAIDDTSIRLAHNGLQPELNLTGFYTSNGRGGNQIDSSTVPPVVVRQGGIGDALRQVGNFDFPAYGFNLQLRLPVRDRAASASLGTALVSKRRSLYQMRLAEQTIILQVRNAVHQLEQSKLSMAASRVARDLAQKNLEAEQRKYELGTQPIFFTLQAQSVLAQAEVSLVSSQIGYQRALTAVEAATGTLLEHHRIKIEEAGR